MCELFEASKQREGCESGVLAFGVAWDTLQTVMQVISERRTGQVERANWCERSGMMRQAMSSCRCTASIPVATTRRGATAHATRATPVVVLDIMDTIVRDPFFTVMPGFFGMTFQELLQSKHPTAWVEFEKGEINEDQLFSKFFKDGREVDSKGLIQAVVAEYSYLPGMESLLQRLNKSGYQLHAMSNYPTWYRYIEDKLLLSQYLSWTFVSCEGPMKGFRKPALDSYQCVIDTLGVAAKDIIFIDDRQVNVDAAKDVGLDAIHFTGAGPLEQQLLQRSLEL